MTYDKPLLKILRESTRRSRIYPKTPRSKFELLRLTNLRSEVRSTHKLTGRSR